MINEDEVSRVLATMGGNESVEGGEAAGQLTGRLAAEIYAAVETGESDFWSGVYTPYTENRITRDVVVAVVEQARATGAGTMPKLAQKLRACDPASEDAEEKKTFYRFKNFLYKTIRIA